MPPSLKLSGAKKVRLGDGRLKLTVPLSERAVHAAAPAGLLKIEGRKAIKYAHRQEDATAPARTATLKIRLSKKQLGAAKQGAAHRQVSVKVEWAVTAADKLSNRRTRHFTVKPPPLTKRNACAMCNIALGEERRSPRGDPGAPCSSRIRRRTARSSPSATSRSSTRTSCWSCAACRSTVPRGEIVALLGRQRRRQDHAAARDHRPARRPPRARSPRARSSSTARGSTAATRPRSCAAASPR